MSPQQWRLPLEVCENVIDEGAFDKHEERYATLSSFALVYSKQRASRLLRTFALSPGLGQYVQGLRIAGNDEGANGWIYDVLRTLPAIVTNLQQLRYTNLPILHPIFFVLSPRFTTITSLSIEVSTKQSFRELVQIINGFRGLEELIFQVGCAWKTPGPFYGGRYSHGIRRITSSFGSYDTDKVPHETHDIHRWILTSRSVNSLVALQLDVYGYSALIDEILRKSYRTLEEVVLWSHRSLRSDGTKCK
ncbi:hypothetical protein NLI96_g10279 [Meripilus lineatus]|uniref:Uncharacterized protein n=1 Tax=Meripilus lineatus TaxID=2056292 RepID=A0AAD5UU80_9APHY|nr:hypothetical protein NLI96_g10279 [Physisporinus lineatus]